MELKEIFQVLTNDCRNAFYVMDYETEEVVYINQAMEHKFQLFEHYSGKKSCEAIPFFMDFCGFEDKSKVVDDVIRDSKTQIIAKNRLMTCNELENTHTLTEEQAECLRSVNCGFGQGYLYSRPIPSIEFTEKYVMRKENSHG